MPKGYIIAHVTVTNPADYGEYVRLNTPVFASFGARFLVRGGQSTDPETPQKARHVIIEFADYETALACYRSPEYQAAAKIRQANSDSDVVIVQGT